MDHALDDVVSAVGPANYLKPAGVDVVHDLPGVGSNLQDHVDVCDSAVLPHLNPSNANAATTMTGKRASGFVAGMTRLPSAVFAWEHNGNPACAEA